MFLFFFIQKPLRVMAQQLEDPIQKSFEHYAVVGSPGGMPFLPSIRVEEALRMAGAQDLSVGE